jgi:hypothetical protein
MINHEAGFDCMGALGAWQAHPLSQNNHAIYPKETGQRSRWVVN